MMNSQNNTSHSDSANPLYGATSPFRLVSRYNIETGKVEPVTPVKAAPERAKTSAVTAKTPRKKAAKKPAKNGSHPAVTRIADAFDYNTRIAALGDDAQIQLLEILVDLEHGNTLLTAEAEAEQDALTVDEWQVIGSLRKMSDDMRKAAQDLVIHLAKPREEVQPAALTDDLAFVASLDSKQKAELSKLLDVAEAEQATSADPLESLRFVAGLDADEYEVFKDELAKEIAKNKAPTWGEMSVMRYEPTALHMIPQAIQTVSLLMQHELTSFYDTELNGEDWADAFHSAVHILAHALDRAKRDTLIVDLHRWGTECDE